MTRTLLRDIARGFVQILYPGACLACGAATNEDERDLCTPCRTGLLDDSHPTCPRCASSIGPNLAPADDCPKCRGQSLGFDRAFRLETYESVRREIILKLKHSQNEGLAEVVGDLWAAHAVEGVRGCGITTVVPVPLHWRRRWSRGYNQSEVLAEAWAKSLHIPLASRWLRRVRSTAMQTSLTPTARRDNVRGAFRARPDPKFRGSVVLLIDDVMTTGETASEAAKALKRAGADRVVVAVLGHG
jgi:ComF family protein